MPTLNLPALEKRIDARRLDPIHLFVGTDVKLVDRLVGAMESTIDAADRAFAVERLYAGDAGGSPVDIAAAARTLPMLGDRRLVIVLRSERLLKPKRAAKKGAAAPFVEDDDESSAGDEPADTAALEDYVAAPVPSTTLLFVAVEIDRGRRLTKRVLEKALVTEFDGLDAEGAGSGPAARWIQEELVRAGRAIDTDAARLLAARAGGDITKLRGDVERLLLFTQGRPRISVADVSDVVSESDAVEDKWAVVNAIAAGDPARALREMGRRLDRGDSVHAMLGQLRWWVSARLSADAPARVRAAIDVLMRTDLALKSSGADERILMERVVIELTGAPIPQRGWGAR